MSTLSFYYPASEVIKATVRTLRKKGYRILDVDSETGSIKARSRFNLFKASSDITLTITEVSSYQTNLSLDSKVDHRWFLNSENVKEKIEELFTQTLYQQIAAGNGLT